MSSEDALHLRAVTASDEGELDRFVRSHPEHGPGHRRAFARVEASLGHQELSWIAERRGHVVAYAPAFLLKEPLFRYLTTKTLVGGSLVAAGPLIDTTLSADERQRLLSTLLQALRSSAARFGPTWLRWVFPPAVGDLSGREFEHPLAQQSRDFTLKQLSGPIVDLSLSEAQIFAEMNSTTRNLVRRAEREGLHASPAVAGEQGAELLAPFRSLSSTAFGGIAAASSYFDAVEQHLIRDAVMEGGAIAHVTQVSKDGVPLSAVVTCESNGLSYYFLSFNTAEGLAAHGNRLALWHAIRGAKLRGARWFQLGSLDTGHGKAAAISAFKRQFGGTIYSSAAAEQCLRPRLHAIQQLGRRAVDRLRRQGDSSKRAAP